ncbi:BMP family ABC transporter substrate-binding protein [Terrilactibacillus sp. BCM23-1]|uniref:BMP family ABC transporter substrate-binding protein n=1 Tax=Terrilactibacillus tamarindi TaxID=2599694 RepID=A0A6N8CU96_9BACI|nr:BMP family ABC transporter substrate-binding protein [Terrilactibacillus tamarindi]MTT32867.1 BMP family ABC transporter substrate-binding protein [Terrilactibacillus tamarindi]
MMALATVVAIAGTLLSACGGASSSDNSSKKEKKVKIGMVTDLGGVNDKSFNQSAWEGLQSFAKKNDLSAGTKTDDDVRYLQSTQATDYTPNLNQLIHQNFNLVFGVGYLMAGDMTKVAQQNPKANLAIIDSAIVDKSNKPLKNVASITFKEEQGSFLVGVVAGLTTKTNKIGFVGGINSELIKKFENGFKAGVKSVNPKAEIYSQYAGAFDAPDKGQAIAATMYGKGADIIYQAAGATGNGVFTEAKSEKKDGKKVWVIGVDRDQYEEGLPENVTLTSMVKRVDKAVNDVSQQTKDGHFPGGQILSFGLKEDGVGIASSKQNVSKDIINQVNGYKEKIIDGSIKVPTTDKEFKAFKS